MTSSRSPFRAVAITLSLALGIQAFTPTAGMAAEKPTETSPVIAFGLSFMLSLGTGHLYADSKWSWRATMFALMDVAGYALMFGMGNYYGRQNSKAYGNGGGDTPMYQLWPVLIFGAQRAWQIADAVEHTRGRNFTLSPTTSMTSINRPHENKIVVPLLTLAF